VRGNRALDGVSGLAASTSLTFVNLHGCLKGGHDSLDSSVGVVLWGGVSLEHSEKLGAAQGGTPTRSMSFFSELWQGAVHRRLDQIVLLEKG
jgi:hypothetical protein